MHLPLNFTALFACAFGLLMPIAAQANSSVWTDGFSWGVRDGDRLTALYSPYTLHYSPSDKHRYVWLVGLERERPNHRISGVTYFSNSFGQPSAYVYPWGRAYRNMWGLTGLFAKWSAGALYGYVGQYKNKVPMNVGGFSPAVIPSLGYERHGFGVQLNLLAAAGLMVQFNVPWAAEGKKPAAAFKVLRAF